MFFSLLGGIFFSKGQEGFLHLPVLLPQSSAPSTFFPASGPSIAHSPTLNSLPTFPLVGIIFYVHCNLFCSLSTHYTCILYGEGIVFSWFFQKNLYMIRLCLLDSTPSIWCRVDEIDSTLSLEWIAWCLAQVRSAWHDLANKRFNTDYIFLIIIKFYHTIKFNWINDLVKFWKVW